MGGDGGLPFYIGQPGKSSLIKGDLGRDLKVMGERRMWLPGGRTFQAEGTAGTKAVRQDYAWHVPGSARRLEGLDGMMEGDREEKKAEGSWGQTLSGHVSHGKDSGLRYEWGGVL